MMNLGTTAGTEVIMEDNSIMHKERAVRRKVLKMRERFFARAECQSFTEAETKTAAEALQRRQILKSCLSLLPDSDLEPNPNHNNFNELYET